MQGDGAVAAVDIQEALGVIARFRVRFIVPSVRQTGGFGNLHRVGGVDDQVQGDGAVTTVDIQEAL